MTSRECGYKYRIGDSYHKFVLATKFYIFHPKCCHVCAEHKRPYTPIRTTTDRYLCYKEDCSKSHHYFDCSCTRLLQNLLLIDVLIFILRSAFLQYLFLVIEKPPYRITKFYWRIFIIILPSFLGNTSCQVLLATNKVDE